MKHAHKLIFNQQCTLQNLLTYLLNNEALNKVFINAATEASINKHRHTLWLFIRL